MATVRRKIRQSDVATHAGVSQTAVSFVLNGKPSQRQRVSSETRARVAKAAQELGYYPNMAARQLKGLGTRLLGVLLGSGAAPVLHHRVTAIEREAMRRGYRVLVGQIGERVDHLAEYVDDFLGRGVDGTICMSHEFPERPNVVPKILSRLPNVVYLRRPQGFEDAPYIHIDAEDGIRQAVDHFLAIGHRRIGMVILDDWRQSNVDRRQGYLSAMGRHALPVDPGLVWVDSHHESVSSDEIPNERADAVIAKLVGDHRADAIIAINDDWAAQLIKAIRRRGLSVPADVAIIGQGNFKISKYSDPEITTLDPNNQQFAEASIRLLVEMIESPEESSLGDPLKIKPKLIVRESA